MFFGKRIMTFRDALLSAYYEEPCRVLPNAIWKTLTEVDNFETSFEVEDGVVMRLEMWFASVTKSKLHPRRHKDAEGLHLYWHRYRCPPNIPKDYISRLKFVLIHQDYLGAISIERFATRKTYFRIMHRNRAIPAVELPSGFRIVNVNIDTEADAVAELIGKCYDNLHPCAESVRSWTNHPVFERNLWLWVIDERKDIPVGLGIAEIDLTIPEASLEYIQVLPEYRRMGLGACIVLELLTRLHGRVEFTTVSGDVENRTNPESLYRRCGFYGEDVWWLLRC